MKINDSEKEDAHKKGAANSRFNLYPDFTLTEDNCASEPIHRPVAIQGQGHLLVINTAAEPTLHAISEHLAPCFGLTTQAIWSEPVDQWLPIEILNLMNSIDASDFPLRGLPRPVMLAGVAFQVTHHQHNKLLKIEFEPEADTHVDEQLISATIQAFREIEALDVLFAEATQRFAQSFEYDRVMVYQFDEDQHGSVVGEHRIDTLTPFLGLHYPETDIPKIARDLFLAVRSRGIADVMIHNDALLFNPTLGNTPPQLDLSHSQLRATSPIHIQYLQNMGVRASLTFAIVIRGQLWGLIACHHCTPRQVLFHHKLIGEAFASLLATRILELEIIRRTRAEATALAVEASLLDRLRVSDDYRVELREHSSSLIDLCNAQGAAVVLGEARGVALATMEQTIFTTGLTLSDSELIAIRDWLIREGHDEVFSTVNFSQDVDVTIDKTRPIGGMLATCISVLFHSYILWFRPPVTQTVSWAGDPENSYSIEPAESGEDVLLSPRQSFAKWQILIEGQSLRWERSAWRMAGRIRQGIFKKELLHTAMLVDRSNQEFMQLTFTAAHDLREPLRTQANYLELINESLEAKEYEDIPHLLQRTGNATHRMGNLISDLLNYSRLAVPNEHENVNLEELIDQVREALESLLVETQATLHVDDLPTLRGDRTKLRQLLLNLLTNAVKYTAPNVVPAISIFMTQRGSFWTLNVKDNGIGIDPQFHEKIFVMFQRLHGKTEYEGTGIGLAVCAKVAKSMGATIGVTSALGQGSTFWLRFHNTAIISNHESDT